MALSWTGDVYVGAETGLVKSVQLHNKNWINLGGKPSEAKRENEILRMCWSDQEEREILMGLRSGDVFKVDMPSQTCIRILPGSYLHLDAETKYVGLESHRGAIIAGVQKGIWAIFKPDDTGIWAPSVVSSMSLKKHQDCRRLRLNESSSHGLVIATGGLNEHLKLWDVNATAASKSPSGDGGDDASAAKPIFAAKNVKNDWLNLKVRTCIQDIRFIPESDQIVTCTGYHQVRVYDPKSQRRPVVDFESGEYPLTCMDIASGNRNHVIVGNTRGVMSQHDLRMAGKLVHGFKGFAGGLRDIRCHASEPLVASVGLDRYLRVHNVVNHRIVNKVYLKSRLNQCLFKTRLNEGLELEGEEEESDKKEIEGGVEEDVEGKKGEEDDVWGKMVVVGEGKKNNSEKEEQESVEETNSNKRKATVTIVEEGEQMQRKRIKS